MAGTGHRTRAVLALLGLAATLTAASSAGAVPGKRIVGGSPADGADWPFAAAVYNHGNFICSGSVIAPRYVLTAGHCLPGGFAQNYRVVTGTTDLTSGGENLRVKRGFVDPNYLQRGHDDFAVLKLDTPTAAPPVTLPAGPEADAATTVGSGLMTAGWGATHPNGTGESHDLLETSTTVVENSQCRDAFPWWASKSEICTRGVPILSGGETSACYGDSGGPLVADTPGGRILVGTTSYGGGRCGKHKPTVFAQISDGLDFIEDAAGL
jgi:secreted trypsin-like serine protease